MVGRYRGHDDLDHQRAGSVHEPKGNPLDLCPGVSGSVLSDVQ